MLILLCIFLMASYFLPALTASHYLLIYPIGCGEWTQEPHKPLTTAGCSTLGMNLRLKEWSRELKPWGSSQPGEFKLHKIIAHTTFEMEIGYADSHEEGRGTTDVFRLADYFEELMWGAERVFSPFPSGLVWCWAAEAIRRLSWGSHRLHPFANRPQACSQIKWQF